MEGINAKIFTSRNALIILFAVFLFLRLFVDSSNLLLSSDHLKYLDPAKHFPYNTMSNNQAELLHGPLFPYAIHFANIIFDKDYIASIFVSLLSACVTFFILYRLFMMLSGDFYAAFTSMVFFTLSLELVIASNQPLKESFLVMLITLSIYYFIKGIKSNSLRPFILSSFFGGLTALTADHAIFLFPIFILSCIFFGNRKTKLMYVALPIIITLLAYGSWLGVKAYQYSNNEFYPSNLDGGPVETRGFTLFALFDPHYFKDWEPMDLSGLDLNIKRFAYNLGYMFNMIPFMIPRGLNFTSMEYLLMAKHVAYMVAIYLPFAIIALFSFLFVISDFIRKRKIRNNMELFAVCSFLVFLFPLFARTAATRYLYMSYIFLYFIIGFGLIRLLKKTKLLKLYTRAIVPIIVISLLLLVPIWYYYHPSFVLSQEKIALGKSVSEFINKTIPVDKGIMAQSGYSIKLNYHLDHRVLGLPPKPDKLFTLLEYYDIDYVVFGKYYSWDKYHFNIDTVEFIKAHPERFELASTVTEDYNKSGRSYTDEIYVYKFLRQNYDIKT